MFHLLKKQQLNGFLWLVVVTILVFSVPISQIIFNENISVELTIDNSLIKIGITILAVWLMAMLMNNICNRNGFLYEKSNLPAAIAIILGSNLLYCTYQEIIGCFIMIFLINKMVKSYGKSHPLTNYFDVGMLIAILSIIFLPNSLLLFALWFSIPILSDVRFKDFWLTVISFLFIWLFYGTYLFLKEDTIRLLTSVTDSVYYFFKLDLTKALPIHYVYLILGTITTLYSINKKRFLSGVQAPILFTSAIFLVVIALFSAFYFNTSYKAILLGIIPLTILSSFYYFSIRKNLANILFYLLIGITIFLQWQLPFQII